MDNTTLNPDTDPENKSGYDDELLRTLVNDKGEVQVANDIYIEKPYIAVPRTNPVVPNASILIRISANDPTLLQAVRNRTYLTGSDFTSSSRGGTGFLYNKSTTVGTTPYQSSTVSPTTCVGWKRNVDFEFYDNDQKRFKFVASLRNYFFTPRIASKTISYKKNSNGKWRRWKTRLVASFSGIVYNENCGAPTALPTRRKEKRRKSVAAKIRGNWGSIVLTIIKSENPFDIDTYHYCNGEEILWGVHW